MPEELTLRDIKRVKRLESKAKKLTKLEKDFYPRLFELLKKFREEYKKAQEESPKSSKALILEDDLKNLEDSLNEIYKCRERKILILALEFVRGSKHELKFLTESEKETYNQLVNALQKGRKSFFKFSTKDSLKQKLEEKKDIIESKIIEKKETNEIVEEKKKVEIDTVEKVKDSRLEFDYAIVRILEDIPSFVAFDMKSYNLSKDDVVTLPKENASFLCENRKAEEILIGIK